VLFYWFFALFFGLIALFLQTKGKIIALMVLIVLGTGLIAYFSLKNIKK